MDWLKISSARAGLNGKRRHDSCRSESQSVTTLSSTKKRRLMKVDDETYRFLEDRPLQPMSNRHCGDNVGLLRAHKQASQIQKLNESSPPPCPPSPEHSVIGCGHKQRQRAKKSCPRPPAGFEQLNRSENCSKAVPRLPEVDSALYSRSPDLNFVSVSGNQMATFLSLIETPVISKFMKFDKCYRVTDKYLLAMTFAYFARSQLDVVGYTPFNFFVALYLAHDMEEDEEDYKYEIFPWALGVLWRSRYKMLLQSRDGLWKKMDYRAVVSKKCCDEIMAIAPNHEIWTRQRKDHHAGAIRPWLKEKSDDGKIIGPNGSPRSCKLCGIQTAADSDHDSLSPDNERYFFNMDTTGSSEAEEFKAANLTTGSSGIVAGFNMKEMQQTLMRSNGTSHTFTSAADSLLAPDISLNWVDCPSDIDDVGKPEA